MELLINSVAYLDTQERDWVSAGKMLQELRSKGITLPLSDALIAAIALRHQVGVLTVDKHFRHLPVKWYGNI